MASSTSDPTRTIMIRRRWIADFTRRYRALARDVNGFILRSETTVIDSLVVNVPFNFAQDAQRVADFLAFLQQRIDVRIFDNFTNHDGFWQNQYTLRAYNRGVNIAQIELAKQGLRPTPRPFLFSGTAVPSLGATTLGVPIHQDALQLIWGRDFAELKGITGTMSGQIARVLTQGIEEGAGAAELARAITNRIDKIGLTRSKLLARTETVRAYNVATINETLQIEEETGADINQEWVTSGDARVRSTHAARNGKIFEPNVARSLIGEPNCRCSLVPFVEELDDAADQEERRQRRAAGIALIG